MNSCVPISGCPEPLCEKQTQSLRSSVSLSVYIVYINEEGGSTSLCKRALKAPTFSPSLFLFVFFLSLFVFLVLFLPFLISFLPFSFVLHFFLFRSRSLSFPSPISHLCSLGMLKLLMSIYSSVCWLADSTHGRDIGSEKI